MNATHERLEMAKQLLAVFICNDLHPLRLTDLEISAVLADALNGRLWRTLKRRGQRRNQSLRQDDKCG